MPQTKEQRRYWAETRKREGRERRSLPKARGSTVLLATSLKEFDQMRRDHPDVTVRLDTSANQQTRLFDTQELIDV